MSMMTGWFGFLRGLREEPALRTAVGIWLIYASVIGVLVAIEPEKRTVTPEYRGAAVRWWAGEQPIYREEGMRGYLYLPQAAMLYTPYTWPPLRVGEVAWRLTGLGLLAWSVWRLCGLFAGDRRGAWFLLATLATLPASFSSARNGQANLPMAALAALAAVDLARTAWSRASLSLVLSLALKPLGAVPCLLAGACYPRMIPRLLLGTAVLLGLAFVHFAPGYVWEQYGMFVHTMTVASRPGVYEGCDIQGILRTFGWTHPPQLPMLGVSALAALGTLVVAWLAVRRGDAARGAFLCMTFAMLYLLLFNPRTETNSYVLIAPFVGVLLAAAVYHRPSPRRLLWLAALALVFSCENWGALHHVTNYWLKPTAGLIFGAILVRDVLRRRDPLGAAAVAS